MEANIAINSDKVEAKPFNVSYGKMMMWFFILSDALTFSGFLIGYGLTRFKFIDSWPIADEVFNHFPFWHGDRPMYFVALMTFILIFSSVTMVLAVDAGHQMKKKKVTLYMFLTIIGGIVFLGSQAWEWKNFINGTYGAVKTSDNKVLQFVKNGHQIALADFVHTQRTDERAQHTRKNGIWFNDEATIANYSVAQVQEAFKKDPSLQIRLEKLNTEAKDKKETKKKIILSRKESLIELNKATRVVEGANLKENEYGHTLFGDFFFFITGFHGFHVLTGIILNIIIFFNVIVGTYERRGHYEMVEKVGLYWHFVDLVWVFVFTFFYLV